jgi:parallel beta-helix repeat protein
MKNSGLELGGGLVSQSIKPSLIAMAVAQAIASAPTLAATINLGAGCTLTDAIISANTDTATGNCTEGSGDDEINFETGGTDIYLNRYAGTPNGLPIITSTITVNGDGGSIIRAAANVDKFRLMEVTGASTTLTLNSLSLRGAYSYPGAFPQFHGGAIYLHDSASLIGNSIIIEDNISQSSSGTGGNGGGINATTASITLNDSSVSNNQARGFGGGIYISYGDLVLNNTEVSDNYGRRGGGGIFMSSTGLTGSEITIYQNTTGNVTLNAQGGGIEAFYNSSINISDSVIRKNTATADGGGINGNFQTSIALSNVQVTQNTAERDSGGGLYLDSSTSVTLTGGTISDNTADRNGGGIYVRNDSMVTLNGVTVSGNSASTGQASRYGGGALVRDSATLISNDTNWSGNYSRYGGAIATRSSTNGATIDINNNTFTANSAAAQGGALRVRFAAMVTIDQSTFTQNNATNGGGAIANFFGTTMTVQESTISNNSSGGGSGFSNSGDLTVINSTISNNTATNYGGGVATTGGSATLINTTLVENQALGGQGGGGIWALNTGYLTLRNSIVAGNISPAGAEVLDNAGSLITADANNIFGTSAVTTAAAFQQFTPGNADIVATSDSSASSFTFAAILGPLTDNGGPTLTHALAKNSPAINSGNTTLCTTDMVVIDQRGEERDDKCDVGSVEVIEDESSFFVDPVPGGKSVIFEL